jgi:hypothetical protein
MFFRGSPSSRPDIIESAPLFPIRQVSATPAGWALPYSNWNTQSETKAAVCARLTFSIRAQSDGASATRKQSDWESGTAAGESDRRHHPFRCLQQCALEKSHLSAKRYAM